LVRPLDIDLFDPLRRISKHEHLVGKDMKETAMHSKYVLLIACPCPKLSDSQLRDEGGVIGQNTKLSIDTRRQDNVDIARE